MTPKIAADILMEHRDNPGKAMDEQALTEALNMAVVALELQDGNLNLNHCPYSMQIRTVKGNVTM
ncbi:MAG: hypothetical protein IJV04_00940 [Lachnospiraceae bacterium]|nr:hypothetical protein [Lachnospiraceae bacterium]